MEGVFMKKNVRWITGSLVFWLLAFGIFGIANDILRFKVVDIADMIHPFYEVEENTLDVLCVGSSHAYHAIQPDLLWGEYGIPSYVLGSPGQTVPCSYYLLREALKYQTPKLVLLETYCFRRTYKFKSDSYMRQAIDGMRFGEVKIEALNDFLPNYSWKEKLSYYVPFLLYHNRWDELERYDFVQHDWLRGGVLDFREVPQKEPAFPEEPLEIPEVNRGYLEEIIKLCKEKGIQLIFFAAPFGEIKLSEKVLRINLFVEEYAAKRNIPFLFYQKTKDLGIDYETDFYDYEHLNSKGTEKLTRKMGEWLVQNYELTDHRQEESYRAWNEDYERYKARYAELSAQKARDWEEQQ